MSTCYDTTTHDIDSINIIILKKTIDIDLHDSNDESKLDLHQRMFEKSQNYIESVNSNDYSKSSNNNKQR